MYDVPPIPREKARVIVDDFYGVTRSLMDGVIFMHLILLNLYTFATPYRNGRI